MNTYPEYVKVNDKKYKINTDFRVAIKCGEIFQDETIGPVERALAVIYLLYGDDGLNDENNYLKLIELAKKYLSCGKDLEIENQREIKPDMDYVEDEGYIRSSFKFDYKYDPYELPYLHWYAFFNDLSNLSNNEFGSCCILSRIRNLRNYDASQVKDNKERQRIIEAQESVALKKYQTRKFTEEEQANMDEFDKLAGLI